MRNLSISGRLLLLLLAALALSSAPAAAQYFGRNKIQYQSFKYQVLKTPHFEVYYYDPGRPAAEDAGRKAERWYARLSQLFQHKLSNTQPLIIYLSHPDFEQTNVTPEQIDEGTGGFTDVFKRRIVLPLGATPADTDHVVGHELVHAFQFDITSQVGAQPGGLPGAIRLPLWFIEGMAEYATLGPNDPNTAMWLRDAVDDKKLPTIKDLDDPRYFPYRWGQAFWAYATGRWGDRVVPDLLRAVSASGDVDRSLMAVLGVGEKDLSKQWQDALRSTYGPVAVATKMASDYGKALVKESSDFGMLNVSPAISPNGKRMAFLSQRDLFSIDLYLADAETGKITSKLTHTAVSPHYTSLGFVNAAGAWASDNRRFAFAAISGGRPAIVVVDVDRGKVEREIPLKELGEIYSLSWSPDNRFISLSAQIAGFTDLFICDLQTSRLRRMTNDQFGDLQPAWSPDGKSIAFVTDRFTTKLANLEIGDYRIALMDPTSGAISPVEGFDTGKNINPQWGPEGKSLYFVSDHNGISNLYRLDREDGRVYQVTNLYTGISGITELSPAMSVASSSGAAVFSVREKGNYNIYEISSPPVLAGVLPGTLSIPANASVLPPAVRVDGLVTKLNADPNKGLPAQNAAFRTSPYRARLSLEGVAQPSVAVGIDRYGTYGGGGLTLFWSDMLGDYALATGFQLNSAFNQGFTDTLKDAAFLVGFQSLKHRWNWAVIAQQTPYLAGGYSSGYVDIGGGQIVGVDTTLIYRQIDRSFTAVTAYPFNRAQRVEFSAGYDSTSFDLINQNVYWDPLTGSMLGQDTTKQPLGSVSFGTVGAALVYDTAQYGATSPVLGQRYRIEADPAFGQVRFTNVLLDYRRYFMPVNFYTFAVRGIHYARYGRDSEDSRLIPLYIGYPNLVRGYDAGSFTSADCSGGGSSSCPEFDNLIGTRMLIGNAEFRFPLLRPFVGVSPKMYGPLPTEVVLFADGGVAWNQGQTPKIFGGTLGVNDRPGVASAGVGLRFNVFGFLIAELDYVHPFQRPNHRWVFQFSFSPGF
jgi:Tol biopolymer transport system component